MATTVVNPTDGTEVERRRLSARVLAGRYFQVKTPVAEDYADNVGEAIEVGEHGVLVHGAPRLGKTMATRWVLNQASNILGTSLPWLEVPVRGFTQYDREAFFAYLLRLVRHRHQDGKITAKRDRLTNWLASRARRSGMTAFAIFFDEAHVFPLHVFRFLLEIDNELDSRGARLFAMLVGQDDLLQLRDRIGSQPNGDQYVERFMATVVAFRGLISEGEVAACLRNFSTTEWPEKSGTTFAEYYIPQLVENRYELETSAPAMWAQFEAHWHNARLDGRPEIPMVHFTRALVLLLNTLSERSAQGRIAEPTPEEIVEAVNRSQYAGYVQRRRKRALSETWKTAA